MEFGGRVVECRARGMGDAGLRYRAEAPIERSVSCPASVVGEGAQQLDRIHYGAIVFRDEGGGGLEVPSRHAGDRYPVIYIHDGQMMFDRSHSPMAGTDWLWDVDKTMTRLIREGEIRPAIVVSVWTNGEKKRSRRGEYMPQKFLTDEIRQRMLREQPDLAGQEYTSDNYLAFLVEELKPFIDETYRTRPGREDTFVIGSSLGGLISAYAIAEYPDVFGGAACMSSHWVVAEGAFVEWLADHWPAAGSHRVYFDHGTETYDAAYGPHQPKMDGVMRNKGYRAGEDWTTRRFEGADHSPRAWRERLHVPLKFLLASPG